MVRGKRTANQSDDIYYSKRRLASALAALSVDSAVSESNKRHVQDYVKYCFAKGIKAIRLRKNVYMLRNLAQILGTDFKEATKEDIQSTIIEIESRSYAEWTKCDYKIILKRFYRWLLGNDEDFPIQVKWIRSSEPKNKLLPEELLTPQEVLKLVDAAIHPRDKAFVMTLYETGTRIGEILPIKIKHLSFDGDMASIFVNGKTGPRRIPIVISASYLAQWLNMHPYKRDPEAYVWAKLILRKQQDRLPTQEMTYSAAKKILEQAFRRAGIIKRCYPHIFRHARASHMANHLTESQLKHYFGWTQSSDMASRYVHMSGRDIDGAIKQYYGIAQEEKKSFPLKPSTCARCGEVLPLTAMFCGRCGLKL